MLLFTLQCPTFGRPVEIENGVVAVRLSMFGHTLLGADGPQHYMM